MCYASTYANWYGTDDNVGNYPQYDIVCDPSIAYGSTEVASKSELQALSILLCKGNDMVQI